MKTEPNDPINSGTEIELYGDQDQYSREVYVPGLTKREYFAGLAMQGYSANPEHSLVQPETRAEWAVKDADALINALNK